ncbi:MAG TPA: POT family MFS transporter [Chthoniobacteraceae bacterium]|jgi:POT family proton-dependent oligopeptide transporter|nr:POT family MFS transporter [Chthoniobacteraceae bacterium]
MSSKPYATAPLAIPGIPPGIPYIVGNEGAERFSYYGMRAILVIFMTKHLMNAQGQLDPMSEADAKAAFHFFSSALYAFPLVGAVLADAFLGKYRTIVWLSILYCFGHLALALDETRLGLTIGLTLIAIGSGGIKPCVAAHLGDQFGPSNARLLPRVFGWFYFAINFGSFISTLLTPYLLQKYGPSVAFGVPGGLMLTATWVFWLGRNKFVHIPPGGTAFLKEAFSREGLGSLGRLFTIYLFVAMFWALYDQTASAWVLQADKMDLRWMGITWLPSQIHAINPILILIFIPIFSYGIYPAFDRFWPLTPLRKIGLGFFLTVPSFLIPAWIETQIAVGLQPNIVWQLLAYVVITAAEVLVSITCLEFSYTQAPRKMKSFIMACFYASVALGNLFTGAVNKFIQNADGSVKFTGAEYYLFFAGLMFITAILFIFVAVRYRERTYIQEQEPAAS